MRFKFSGNSKFSIQQQKKNQLELVQSFLFQVRGKDDTRKQVSHKNKQTIVNKAVPVRLLWVFPFSKAVSSKKKKETNFLIVSRAHIPCIPNRWWKKLFAPMPSPRFHFFSSIAFIWFAGKLTCGKVFTFLTCQKVCSTTHRMHELEYLIIWWTNTHPHPSSVCIEIIMNQIKDFA